MKMITNKKAICVLISALALFALPAQASFIQELFDSGGSRFGVLEFATIDGEDKEQEFGITGLISASVEVGGITWTVADAFGGGLAWVWDGVNTNEANFTIRFRRSAQLDGEAFIRLSDWDVRYSEGRVTDAGLLNVNGGLITTDDLAEVTRDSVARVAAVPTPGTLALLMVGLAGVGYSRKRFVQVKRV